MKRIRPDKHVLIQAYKDKKTVLQLCLEYNVTDPTIRNWYNYHRIPYYQGLMGRPKKAVKMPMERVRAIALDFMQGMTMSAIAKKWHITPDRVYSCVSAMQVTAPFSTPHREFSPNEMDYGTIDFNERYKYAEVKGEMPTVRQLIQ